MSWFSRRRVEGGPGPILRVDRLNVYYGRAHAVQDVSLTLDRGILAVVGRNGMGKTTLCNAITGLVAASGSIKLSGTELVGLAPHAITGLGVGYVPQGRRVWPSLTVDEHLRLAERSAHRGVWTIERIYDLFPRLAERRGNGGYQLSGGEQQMLAIGRALLFNPRLLVMDEPTEGLAPVIVETLTAVLLKLRSESELSIILVEQNSRVAFEFSDRSVVLDKGRIVYDGASAALRDDPERLAKIIGVAE